MGFRVLDPCIRVVHARVVMVDLQLLRREKTIYITKTTRRQPEDNHKVPIRRPPLLPRFLKLGLALRTFIRNSCPGFVLQFFPLFALVFGSQAANTQSGFAIEFTDADARRFDCH
jgi:hypothetical protein